MAGSLDKKHEWLRAKNEMKAVKHRAVQVSMDKIVAEMKPGHVGSHRMKSDIVAYHGKYKKKSLKERVTDEIMKTRASSASRERFNPNRTHLAEGDTLLKDKGHDRVIAADEQFEAVPDRDKVQTKDGCPADDVLVDAAASVPTKIDDVPPDEVKEYQATDSQADEVQDTKLHDNVSQGDALDTEVDDEDAPANSGVLPSLKIEVESNASHDKAVDSLETNDCDEDTSTVSTVPPLKIELDTNVPHDKTAESSNGEAAMPLKECLEDNKCQDERLIMPVATTSNMPRKVKSWTKLETDEFQGLMREKFPLVPFIPEKCSQDSAKESGSSSSIDEEDLNIIINCEDPGEKMKREKTEIEQKRNAGTQSELACSDDVALSMEPTEEEAEWLYGQIDNEMERRMNSELTEEEQNTLELMMEEEEYWNEVTDEQSDWLDVVIDEVQKKKNAVAQRNISTSASEPDDSCSTSAPTGQMVNTQMCTPYIACTQTGAPYTCHPSQGQVAIVQVCAPYNGQPVPVVRNANSQMGAPYNDQAPPTGQIVVAQMNAPYDGHPPQGQNASYQINAAYNGYPPGQHGPQDYQTFRHPHPARYPPPHRMPPRDAHFRGPRMRQAPPPWIRQQPGYNSRRPPPRMGPKRERSEYQQ